LRSFFASYVKSLHHHGFPGHARQRHSPSWYGEEKRRSRAARDKKCAACFRAEFAPTADLGAGTEEVCPDSRDCAGPEDDQQKRRLLGAEKSRRSVMVDRALSRALLITPAFWQGREHRACDFAVEAPTKRPPDQLERAAQSDRR